MVIDQNAVVTLEAKLKDSDGNALGSESETMVYLHGGHGGIFPLVEQGLAGKQLGDEFFISLQPEDAFGEYDEELIRVEPQSVFPANVAIGMQFEGVPPGEEDDRWIVYTVTDIADGQVVIDGNHPLAGERLLFSCIVKDIRPATAEELSHGHVHGVHGAHH
ncbi:MAG: peptidylprolyl isomerase [Betaproteobacteria bacterium]